ncbi:uncharacterized protein LOC143529376 [Bidens hawaiensis]|uniref:uncharacterized protein LOC143529376 n=1 Tax=Bidens hawaiensis TaxID=980011 RepID=UPI00404A4688
MPGFFDFVVSKCCRFRFNGPADLALTTKFRWLKNGIKIWLEKKKKELNSVYDYKKQLVLDLELVAQQRPLSTHEQDVRSECVALIESIDLEKQKDLRQKARVCWALDGDDNSAYFHRSWNSNPAVMKGEVFNYFVERFTEPIDDRPRIVCSDLSVLDDEEASCLVVPFSLLEIKNVVWDCQGDRSPGPDGLNFKTVLGLF